MANQNIWDILICINVVNYVFQWIFQVACLLGADSGLEMSFPDSASSC